MRRKIMMVVLALIAAVLLVVFGLWLNKRFYPSTIGRQLRSAYPPGTRIDNPQKVPADFPKGIVNTGLTFTHIDTVNYPSGKEDITLAYNSTKSISDLFVFYSDLLKSKNWTIQSSQKTANSAVIMAINSLSNKLFVTIVKTKEGSTVTLLYKK